MFAINCPHHGARTLLDTDSIRALHNTTDGIVLEVECWCGGLVTVRTGHEQRTPEPALV